LDTETTVTTSRTPTVATRTTVLEALPRLRRFARCLTGAAPAADSLVQTAVALALACGGGDSRTLLRDGFRHCIALWDEVTAGTPARAADGLQGVEGAMAALPVDQRAVLALVAVEDCSYETAAAILEVPIATVLARLARARAALADRMAEEAEPVFLARFELAR
jgi:RNA polymerase sigma-70 factor (ECF subfamily)